MNNNNLSDRCRKGREREIQVQARCSAVGPMLQLKCDLFSCYESKQLAGKIEKTVKKN